MYNNTQTIVNTHKIVLCEGEGGKKKEFGEKTVISQPVPSLSVSGGRHGSHSCVLWLVGVFVYMRT